MQLLLGLPLSLPRRLHRLPVAVALLLELGALFGIHGHGIESVLQAQPALTQFFLLTRQLLLDIVEIGFQLPSTNAQLLSARLLGRQLGARLGQTLLLLLLAPSRVFALALQPLLGRAAILQALLLQHERFAELQATGLQLFQFTTARQHTAFGGLGTPHAQEVPGDPIAFRGDQALPRRESSPPRQGLVVAARNQHLPQPGRQVARRLHFFQQTAQRGGHRTGRCQAQGAAGEGVDP